MQAFFGNLRVNGIFMSRGDYYDARGWPLPDGLDPKTEGYMVLFEDLTEGFADPSDLAQWYTASAFMSLFSSANSFLNFSDAMYLLREGERVSRNAWDQGTFLMAVNVSSHSCNLTINGAEAEFTHGPLIYQGTSDHTLHIWNPTYRDMWANDWYLQVNNDR